MVDIASEIKPYLQGLSEPNFKIIMALVSETKRIKCLDDFFELSLNVLCMQKNCGKKRALEIFGHIQNVRKLYKRPDIPPSTTLRALQDVMDDTMQITSELAYMKIHDVTEAQIDDILLKMTKAMQKTLGLRKLASSSDL